MGNNNGQLTVHEWAENHKHFQQLRNTDGEGEKLADMVAAAVKTSKRILCPFLMFRPPSRINASLETTAHAIVDAALFVAAKAKAKRMICPFQLDVVIGYQPIALKANNMD